MHLPFSRSGRRARTRNEDDQRSHAFPAVSSLLSRTGLSKRSGTVSRAGGGGGQDRQRAVSEADPGSDKSKSTSSSGGRALSSSAKAHSRSHNDRESDSDSVDGDDMGEPMGDSSPPHGSLVLDSELRESPLNSSLTEVPTPNMAIPQSKNARRGENSVDSLDDVSSSPKPPPPPAASKKYRSFLEEFDDDAGSGDVDPDDKPIGGPGQLSVRELARCKLEGNVDAAVVYLDGLESLTAADRETLLERVDNCFREMADEYRQDESEKPAPKAAAAAPPVPKRAASVQGGLSAAPPAVPARGAAAPVRPRLGVAGFKLTLEDHSEKGLTVLPESTLENPDAQKLILSSNALTEVIPAQMLAYSAVENLWPNLQLLDLSHNRITQVPSQLPALAPSLRVLNLTGNIVSDFPFEFLELQQLTTLYLASNNLQVVPFVVTQLASLRDLHLGRNEIGDLGIQYTSEDEDAPSEVAPASSEMFRSVDPALLKPPRVKHKWHDLACLNLRQNNIVDIAALGSMHSLTVLKMQDNLVEEIPHEFTELSDLRVLVLARNRIWKIPSEMAKLESLLQLDLSENRIGFGRSTDSPSPADQEASLVNLGKLQGLQDLSLMHNGITVLPADFFAMGSSLETLNIAHNSISELPDELLRLESMCQLLCAFNRISKLPTNMSKLRSLSVVNFTHNKLTELPAEVLGLPFLQVRPPFFRCRRVRVRV
jgi:Leucine-rich repeat (LRR) protein